MTVSLRRMPMRPYGRAAAPRVARAPARLAPARAGGRPASDARRRWAEALAPAVLGVAAVGLLAAFDGGYYPSAWSWSSFVLLWVAASAVLVSAQVRLSALEVVSVVALAAFVGWIALSTVWSSSASATIPEAQRALVYVAGLLAALLVSTRRSVQPLLAGTLAAITLACAYGLATRLLPERLGTFDPVAGYRLQEPLGYWNALGIFAALGAVLALGFGSRGRSLVGRGLAGASLVVLLPTLYFTFTRGAWLALALGLSASVVLDPRRLQAITALVLLAVCPLVAVVAAAQSEALTREDAALAAATREGHRLALVVVALAVVNGLAAAALAAVERRLRVRRAVRAAYAGALVVLTFVTLAGVFARYGSPPTLVEKGYDAFTAPPPRTGEDLNARLFNFSGTWRIDLWRVASRDVRAHPWVGSAAGSYERQWLRERDIELKVRDAHSLYLETLAELGPLGLALLLTALVVPAAAAVKARRSRLVPAAFGAYAAYLVHAGIDWDWEMPAVTLAALFCGAALLVAGRRPGSGAATSLRFRLAAVAAILPIAALALVGLVANAALSKSASALADGDWAKSEAEARRAAGWAPWSAEPWERLGQAQLGRGDLGAARASFRKAIGKDGRDWELWLGLASASEGTARRHALRQARKLNPLDAGAEQAALGAHAGTETGDGGTGPPGE